jgi:cytochrome c oxidase subunit 3
MHVSLGLGMLNTILLALSGITVFSAVNSARLDRPATARMWLILTMALGVSFLGIKFSEYANKHYLGLLPSINEKQIYQQADREYVSAVDQRLVRMIAELESQSATTPLSEADRSKLDRLYELRSYMSTYTANSVGRGNDDYIGLMHMKLMAHQIFPHSDTTRGLEEVLTVDLGNLRGFSERLSNRLNLARGRVPMIEEQIASLEKSVRDAAMLSLSEESANSAKIESEKWIEVKKEQIKALNVEIDGLALRLKPVQGRVQMLEYFADPQFEDGFNAALGLRLPVVITNGQPWMSVFLLLTGMHALHLIAGLLVFLWFLPRRLDIRRAASLHIAAMYWQLVDVIWLALFWLIYF